MNERIGFSFLLLLGFVSLAAPAPDVYWSMNELNAGVLKPDIPAVDNGTYSVDFSGTKYIGTAPGFYGNGLKIFGQVVSFPNVRSAKLCVMEPWNCGDTGFSVAGWFVVRSAELFDCLMSTSVFCGPSLAGMFLRSLNNKLQAAVYLTTGELYTASSPTLIADEWTHVGVTWSGSGGIEIYINGSAAIYTEQPAVTTRFAQIALPNLQIGYQSSSSTLVVDDLKIWNHALSPEQMFEALPQGPGPVTTSTTTIQPSSTTSHTTTLKPPSTITLKPPFTTTLKPPSATKPVTTSDETVTTTLKPPSTTTLKPQSATKPVTTSDETVTTTLKPPSTTTLKPPSATKPVTTSGETVTTTWKPPSTTTLKPPSATKPVMTSSETVTTNEEPPSTTTFKPPSATKPVTTSDETITTTLKPPSTTKPVMTSSETVTTYEEPTTSTDQSQVTEVTKKPVNPNKGNWGWRKWIVIGIGIVVILFVLLLSFLFCRRN